MARGEEMTVPICELHGQYLRFCYSCDEHHCPAESRKTCLFDGEIELIPVMGPEA